MRLKKRLKSGSAGRPSRPSADLRVVPLADKHIASFREAIDVIAKERRYLLMVEAPPLAQVRKFVRAKIKQRHPAYVALDDGRVVGWCDVIPGDRETTAHAGVLGIGVLPGYRGRGIGNALFRSTLKRAKARGLSRVELTVRSDNRRAIALYRKHGFVREGVKRNGMRVDGRYWDLVCMARLFK